MANALYPKWKETLLQNDANSALNSAEGATGVYVALVDIGTYTYNATHQFYSDLGTSVVGTDQEILTKTQLDGVFDGTDVVFPNVSGTSVEALVIYRKTTGTSSTWPLIAYIDSGVTGLPVTPNGGNINITWDVAGIFQL